MITDREINPSDYAISDDAHKHGAVASFQGVVRAHNNGRVVRGIHYDCYRDMAESEMRAILDAFIGEGVVVDACAVHRIGDLAPGDVSLLVVVASPHRADAFEVCRRVVDAIKQRVPIWKKEHYADQTAEWL